MAGKQKSEPNMFEGLFNLTATSFLALIYVEVRKMQTRIDELVAEVQETKGAVQSAVKLINGLLDRVEQSADDPDELRAAIEELRTARQELASAVGGSGGNK